MIFFLEGGGGSKGVYRHVYELKEWLEVEWQSILYAIIGAGYGKCVCVCDCKEKSVCVWGGGQVYVLRDKKLEGE